MNRPYLVAEISGNHNGSIDRAMMLIAAAKQAGADAVKFQLYDPKHMAPSGLTIESGIWAGRNAQELYREAQTPHEWFPSLIRSATINRLDWFSSVFDVHGLAILEELGCPRYKISSFEIVDLKLIKAVAATDKPMVISMGMATLDETLDALRAADPYRRGNLTLLKCTSAYPAMPEDANLATIQWWKDRTHYEIGLSDHTLGIGVAVAATALGASMIEKHLTLKRSDGGPDAAFSMEPEEFAQMVTECRRAAAAIGEVRYGPLPAEVPQMQLRGRTLMKDA